MASFEGKVIAITGAASGMGLATATLLASRGAFLSLADVNEENLQKAIAALSSTTSSKSSADTSGAGGAPGTRHMSYVVDVRSSATIDAWIEATVQKFGRLDGAVNMAGIITPAKPITETTDEAWGFSMDVNAKGVFACLRAELKTMNEGGSIVSTSSTFGQFGAPGNAPYCASKAAVIALTRTAAKENPKIRVNVVAPGSVNTPLSQGEDPEDVKRGLQVTVQKRRAEASEVATVVAFLLSEDASFVTGAVYNVDGGWVC